MPSFATGTRSGNAPGPGQSAALWPTPPRLLVADWPAQRPVLAAMETAPVAGPADWFCPPAPLQAGTDQPPKPLYLSAMTGGTQLRAHRRLWISTTPEGWLPTTVPRAWRSGAVGTPDGPRPPLLRVDSKTWLIRYDPTVWLLIRTWIAAKYDVCGGGVAAVSAGLVGDSCRPLHCRLRLQSLAQNLSPKAIARQRSVRETAPHLYAPERTQQ